MARWLLFSYRLPAKPPGPRLAVWRALQRMDGGYLHDGAFLAPFDDAAQDAFAHLAHDVRNDGGEASVLRIQDADDPRHLEQRLKGAAREGPRGRRKR